MGGKQVGGYAGGTVRGTRTHSLHPALILYSRTKKTLNIRQSDRIKISLLQRSWATNKFKFTQEQMIFRFIVSIENHFGVRCSRRNLFVIYVCKNLPQKKKQIRTILRGNHCITVTYDKFYLFVFYLTRSAVHILFRTIVTWLPVPVAARSKA